MRMTINPENVRKKKTSDAFLVTSDGTLAAVAERLEDGDSFLCHPVLTRTFRTEDYDLPWHLVGVYK